MSLVPNDLDVNRHIRKVLVKHWIDLGRLSIRSSRGKVTIHGLLDRIAGVKEQLTPSIVDSIFKEIDRINGVQNVLVDLVNWAKSDGAWRSPDRGRSLIDSKAATADSRETSYDIN